MLRADDDVFSKGQLIVLNLDGRVTVWVEEHATLSRALVHSVHVVPCALHVLMGHTHLTMVGSASQSRLYLLTSFFTKLGSNLSRYVATKAIGGVEILVAKCSP